MWRVNTDTLPVWGRVMTELEAMVGLGTVSRPGAWGFPDCLELGVPGNGVLTWEESKTHLALYAISSSPLFIGNDVRPGRVQQRVLDLLLNPDMLRVNQAYERAFAGDRLWTAPTGKEVWGKPIGNNSAAAVVFNRNGTTSRCIAASPIEAPCDDNATDPSYSGVQNITLDFGLLGSRGWLGGAGAASTAYSCEVFSVFATAAAGRSLGRFVGGLTVELPPHGSEFVIVSGCQ